MHDKSLAVHVGVDAGLVSDPAAIVAVYNDLATKQVRLAFHRIFVPPRGGEINLEDTIAATLRVLKRRYNVVQVLYDPWQMEAMAQQLLREKVPMEKFNQTPANLTGAAQNLLELINARNLVLYPDRDRRTAASRVIASEIASRGGWKLDKAKQAHKIDVIVALSMACHSAIEGLSKPQHPTDWAAKLEQARAHNARRRMGVYGAEWNGMGERRYLQMMRGHGGNTTY